ncbi:protein OXIDATIVE STRESS 3-like [Miscanthus floridulus]|uniref:protein OXIDATIVE STRESS 3-like n=1 Tax=Miscanthus floridulus TaxID=154761 RepID=UPI00345AE1C3
MAEPYNLASHAVPLCHKEICNKPGDDHSESASFSGASSGSLCSSASNVSDDATSSPLGHPSQPSSASSSTLHLDAEGPLYELSSLLDELPIRKGLSNYYQGKAQSFTSISDATSVQDLAKKISYSKRMRACKSYSVGLDMNQRSIIIPRPGNKVIAKKTSNGSFAIVRRTSNTSHLNISTKSYAHQSKRDALMHIDLQRRDN